MKFIYTWLFLMIGINIFAQEEFFLDCETEIPVTIAGNVLENPWAGGLNSPQISRIDLNQDGNMDLFVFDRDMSRILTFLNTDAGNGAISYKYTCEYNHLFPSMTEWALLRDFDCDGKIDIFTKRPNSMGLYRNSSTVEDGLQFELVSDLLEATYNYSGVPFDAPVFCVTVDIPAIHDHDNDGDLDIFTFSEIASTVYYYKNFAVENGDCSAMDLELVNRCYGFFNEASENNTLFLADEHECDFNVLEPEYTDDGDRLHTGGTLLCFDTNDDGYKEMMIGDVSVYNLNQLMIEPSVQGPDSAVQLITTFPESLQNTIPVEMKKFPAGYYEDINNDGVPDLLVSTNSPSQGEDDESIWFYINNGTETLPDFEFIQTDFLQDEMIEFGRGARPILEDYNGDGLNDLFLANKEFYEDGPQPPSILSVLTNVGTADSPAYELEIDELVPLDDLNIIHPYPSFFDLDGDGDKDLLIGDQGGKLHYFRNDAAEGQPMTFVLDSPNFEDANGDEIDVGQSACPFPFDIDGDGAIDLLIGEKNGNINYYRNIGQESTTQFELVNDTLGEVIASNLLGINGYAVPHFFQNNEGETLLLLGTETGQVNYYNNIDGNLDGAFNLIEEAFTGLDDGGRCSPWFEDINNDGRRDLFFGTSGGGVRLFMGQSGPDNIVNQSAVNSSFKLYPNPALLFVMIETDGFGSVNQSIALYDQLGRTVRTWVKNGNRFRLNLDGIGAGHYIVRITDGTKIRTEKLILLDR